MPMLVDEYDSAKYELDRANSREEYEYAREIFDEVKGRKDAAMEKQRIAQEAFDTLNVSVPDLKQAYDDATQARKDQAKFIKDEANIDVDEYDVTQGPPGLPEEDAATTGSTDGSTTGGSTDGSTAGSGSTDGSTAGSGSGGSGAAAGGSG